MKKINLIGLNQSELQAFVASLGEKPYRAQQVFEWLYGHAVGSFEEMTNLSRELRARLNERATIDRLQVAAAQRSAKDFTTKFLFQLKDGRQIESVLMVEEARTTLCISTQAGCAIDCKFCATGMMGLQRNLTAGEIVDQLLVLQQETGAQVRNLVCMGMGEPFHNYENVVKACTLMSHDLGPNLAQRHIVVSTSGIVPKILRFADEGHKFRLAISLNATTDAVRSRLMPLNKKWPIARLLEAAKYYTEKSRQPVTFEYVLMSGINDSEADAHRLKKSISGMYCKVNLIPYNATEGEFKRPSEARILRFYEALSSLRAPVTIRWSKGDDIEAGCGQLAAKNEVSL